MSVATPALPLATPTTSASARTRSVSPSSILRPCSSVVLPSKDAAGNRNLGWLAAPPKDLTAPRPAPIVVAELQPQAQQFNARAAGSPTHSSDEAESSRSVPPLSPSASQDSMAESNPSLPDTFDSQEDGDSTPRSSAACSPSPAIRFGCLPERPPELRRRNSITLGVLARKNMLSAQNAGAGQGSIKKVLMTDDEWEAYQEKFAQKSTNQAVDIGAVVKNGATKFFGKLRRSGSNASTTSTTSTASIPSGSSSTSSQGRARSDSAPGQSSAARLSDRVAIAPTVREEDEDEAGGLGLSTNDAPVPVPTIAIGDETPRRGRSPSPTHHAPHQHRHFERSPSPPAAVFHDEDDDGDEEEFEDAKARASYHTDDDTSYEHARHHTSTEAALGFEMSDYNHSRPAWGRRNSAHETSQAA